MHYLAASQSPTHFLNTVAKVLMGFGGAMAAVVLIAIGFKVLVTSARPGGGGGYGDEGGSGLRRAFEEAGTVLVALFFIFGAFFIVGIITQIVSALQK